MIARQHRFHGYSSLSFVYRRGRTVRDQHLAVRFVRNSRRSEYRLAVIVSRKVHKSAVTRNRVRRRIYEIVRTGAVIAEPYDIVMTVFSDQIVEMPVDQLTRLVLGLLEEARLTTARPSPHDIVETKE